MFLYLESLNKNGITDWYYKVGDALIAQLVEAGYQCQRYTGYDSDYRIDVKCGNELLKIIVVVYKEDPIKGSVNFEIDGTKPPLLIDGSTAESDQVGALVRALSPRLLQIVSNIQDMTDCRWLSEYDFREAMHWFQLKRE